MKGKANIVLADARIETLVDNVIARTFYSFNTIDIQVCPYKGYFFVKFF